MCFHLNLFKSLRWILNINIRTLLLLYVIFRFIKKSENKNIFLFYSICRISYFDIILLPIYPKYICTFWCLNLDKNNSIMNTVLHSTIKSFFAGIFFIIWIIIKNFSNLLQRLIDEAQNFRGRLETRRHFSKRYISRGEMCCAASASNSTKNQR